MKKRMFSLISVVMLIVMILPTASPPVVAAQAENGQAATNSTSLVADFVFDVPECPSCAGVEFMDRSTGGVKPYTYDWDFGDGNNSTQPNPRHRYVIGTYTVTLTVTDSAGDIASKSQTVTVGAATNAKDVELDSGVSLTAVNSSWPRCNSGCTANDAVTVRAWIVADPYCTPGSTNTAELWLNFSITRQNGPYCAVAVMDIYVDNVRTYDEYKVDIGDLPGKGEWPYKIGEINWPCGSELELRDIYVQWMTNDQDPCEEDCKEYPPSKCWIGGPLYVHTPLVADFEFNNVCYCNNTIFTDATTGGVEPYTSWYWDFGDGSDSTAQNPTHHYDAPGTYSVTLTVTDSDDPAHSDSQSYDVTVYEGPTADFSADVFDCCDPLEVQFTDLSTAGDNPIVSWYWEFGDGYTSTDPNPSHIYDDGVYTVSLTVTDYQ
jgi:PKD repeat protein